MVNNSLKSTRFTPGIPANQTGTRNKWSDQGKIPGRISNIPAVRIAEDKDSYTVSIAVPGKKLGDFRIDVVDGAMTVNAGPHSSFTRSFSLPPGVNKREIQATYDSGALWILLPKRKEAKKVMGQHASL